MTTAVGVMDAPALTANTDVLVIASAKARLLLWIPRDLWCERIGDRINRAFVLGRHEGLARALGDYGFEIDASLVLDRRASERALAGAAVEVPVTERLEFWYPTSPPLTTEEAHKEITFEPPSELLEGERVHQWIGARFEPGGEASDLARIARQQVFVRALLEQGFDFGRALEVPEQVAISGPALDELHRIDSSFTFATFATGAVGRIIDGKDVLVL
jgi:hypothetical protein